MNSMFHQDGRFSRLTTEAGKDAIVLQSLEGTEELSGEFEWRVECLSKNPALDLNALLGTHATVTVATSSGQRHFDGIVAEATHAGAIEAGHRYDLVLRPWLHLASLRRNNRIFHNQTVVDIVQEVLSDYSGLGDPHLETKLNGVYPPLEYTVQYAESDAAFVRRMLERFGITTAWVHSSGSHTLLLSDNIDAHPEIPGGSRPFYGNDSRHVTEQECFREWSGGSRITTGAVRLTEYNFKLPKALQEVDRTGDASHPHGQIESFDYPGDYLEQGQGKGVVVRRLDEERGQAVRHVATGEVADLGAGRRVKISGEEMADVTGRTFLCLKATHKMRAEAYGTGNAANAGERAYDGTFVLIPDDAPLRPERRTPLARIEGPQTAMVVGAGEIDCDEYGRILVRFHWDLDEEYSMRCRVSQNWASRGWGGMVVPRIGMEVIVEFLEGDPDKPIVTGCVYNAANMPPAALPENKTRSIFKTKTHLGKGFNELTFEDKEGEEFIYMHAQKNLDMHVLNSAKRRVEFDDNVSVGNASNLDVAADRTETIEGKLDVSVTGRIAEKTDADRAADVSGDYAIKTGGDLTIKAGGEIVLDASKVTLVSGGSAVVVQAGAVNVAPVLNVGSASPGAAAVPAIPAVLKAAAGAGSAFVSHCPMKDGNQG